ncbi:hypothetical protein A2969_04180 [Candidatus Woesebacteria bacterium RIFCSPLOWO2_01_FULL_42_67]|nr:MAG: hypothetical protein A2W15_05540 [Candidatus Woesebacteria bacterium RBG_16_41_13]OGM66130.1 MAG: hypothetical protein A2969_04180 [Candidatus Woesebacteria bacterium RIFCSPLOWO2_01_FULL_42_67]OGM73746.1 MAG: hypothetical protein A3H21_03115 [Candidatus Woesebacteria bacterium RIFCSPLOWO2_12_FULL_42_8]
MDYQTELGFNPILPAVMHIDLNSCFASIEQQANPLLRGKPVAVAAYRSPNGCILAASVEAKKMGVKTGMKVKEGKFLCPGLFVLESDPWKYRNVHLALRKIVSGYTDDFSPKSIDEFVLAMAGTVHLFGGNMTFVAQEIKRRIKVEVGDWLTVSIGIAPNRFLAKVASNLYKPDGLTEITKRNFLEIYQKLKLVDLPYIKLRNAIRLSFVGIATVEEFYMSPIWKLQAAFKSVNGYYWYLRLRGWEIDDVEFGRKTYGNSYALPNPLTTLDEIAPVLSKLVEKTGFRLRKANLTTSGVHIAIYYRDGYFWHRGVTFQQSLFDSRDIFKKALFIAGLSPYKKPIRNIFISCFNLKKKDFLQLNIFEDLQKRERLVSSIDETNKSWGDFVLTPARMLYLDKVAVPDRIAFGGVKELEEFTLQK